MAISKSITLPETGLVCPAAYGRIDDSLIGLGSGILKITLNWYVSQQTASNSLRPIRTDEVNLSTAIFQIPNPEFTAKLKYACDNGLISTPQDALKSALYILIQQQSAYEGTQLA